MISAANVYARVSTELQNRNLNSEKVETNVSKVIPKNKTQAIQIARLPEEEQLEAAIEIAEESGGKPTVAIAKEIVNRRLGKVSGSDDVTPAECSAACFSDFKSEKVGTSDLRSPRAAADNEPNPTDDKAMRQPHRNVINKKEKMIKSSVIYKTGPVYIEGELLNWVISCKQQSVVERLKKWLYRNSRGRH